VLQELKGSDSSSPFRFDEYVKRWWIVDGNIAVGWDENPSKGWRFLVKPMFEVVTNNKKQTTKARIMSKTALKIISTIKSRPVSS
jgi:hypothetical protein